MVGAAPRQPTEDWGTAKLLAKASRQRGTVPAHFLEPCIRGWTMIDGTAVAAPANHVNDTTEQPALQALT